MSSSHSNLQFLSRQCLLQEKTWFCKVFETHSKTTISIILSGLESVCAIFLKLLDMLFCCFCFLLTPAARNLFLELKICQKLLKMARNFHRLVSIDPFQTALF